MNANINYLLLLHCESQVDSCLGHLSRTAARNLKSGGYFILIMLIRHRHIHKYVNYFQLHIVKHNTIAVWDICPGQLSRIRNGMCIYCKYRHRVP